MRLNNVRNALLTVTQNVGHYKAYKKADKYIVWAEDGADEALHADNTLTAQAISGTVDYFTKEENDSNVRAISNALTSAGIPHRMNSIQFEDLTGYIHYEWKWEIGTNDI